jgi:DNA processing protein
LVQQSAESANVWIADLPAKLAAEGEAERAYWLAWSRIKQVGPVTIKRLWEEFGSLAIAWQANAAELLAVDGIGLLSAENIVAQRPTLQPEKLLAQHEAENQSFWTPADPDYPALLFAINDPPPLLYYRGQLRLNALPFETLSVGIVGTRRPSAYGDRWTKRLSARLAREGAIIVSGLAQGIDTAAHTSCLAQGGLTVAVLGTGVDQVYPLHNRQLYEQIVATGLVVSEYPDGTGPDKKHFPQRNRIIAGLSRAILVTEAPERSGALITSRLANDYCRDVYALPCGLDNVQGEGCLQLISQGAQMILGEQALVDTLREIPPIQANAPGQLTLPLAQVPSAQIRLDQSHPAQSQAVQSPPTAAKLRQAVASQPSSNGGILPDLSPMLTQVLKAVPCEPVWLDQIVQVAQMETGEVLGALVQLELLGLVTQLPGMQYQRG